MVSFGFFFFNGVSRDGALSPPLTARGVYMDPYCTGLE